MRAPRAAALLLLVPLGGCIAAFDTGGESGLEKRINRLERRIGALEKRSPEPEPAPVVPGNAK